MGARIAPSRVVKHIFVAKFFLMSDQRNRTQVLNDHVLEAMGDQYRASRVIDALDAVQFGIITEQLLLLAVQGGDGERRFRK